MGPRLRGDDGRGSFALLLRRGALDKGLAALHLVGERRFVDLDHYRIGIDAEVLHQRLRDVAHHAGLLLVGAAGGHAHGNFRHSCLSLCSCYVTLATNTILILRSGLFGRVSKDAPIVLMVRDGARAPPHHEGYPHLTSWRASVTSCTGVIIRESG